MVAIEIKNLNQSLCSIHSNDKNVLDIVTKNLSIYYPNYQWMPAVRAGLSDGKKRLYKIASQNVIIFPRGLVSYLISKFEEQGYKVDYTHDTYSLSKEEFEEFVESLKLPFAPRDYQKTAAFESLVNKRQVNVMATGAGKSLTIYLIIRYMLQNNKKTVLIVPNISLVEQMYNDFVDYGFTDIDFYVRRIGGDHKVKAFDFPITISTWQSLYKSPELFSDVNCIIADECHKTKSDVFENIIFPSAINTDFRLGFTGTLPKELLNKTIILSVIGPSKKYISTRQLIDLGLATPVTIKCVFLNYSTEESRDISRLKYQDEVKYITFHKKRNNVLVKLIEKVYKERGNTIVLFDRIEHGELLTSKLLKSLHNVEIDLKLCMSADNPYNIYLVTGSTPAVEREKIRKLLEEKEDAIILGTSSILSTGINIKRLHNMVLTSGGRSSIKLNQSIGRMLRTHSSKNMVYIYDIIDDASIKYKTYIKKNSLYKQFEERLEIYQDNEYELQEIVINL